MPISDNLVVQHLLQLTEAYSQPLLWRETDSGAHEAELQGLRVRMDKSYSSTGSRLYVLVVRDSYTAYISEPLSISFWKTKYKSADEAELARLLKALLGSIERQCAERRKRDLANGADLRQQMFRQLLFGVGEEKVGLREKSNKSGRDSGNVTKVL